MRFSIACVFLLVTVASSLPADYDIDAESGVDAVVPEASLASLGSLKKVDEEGEEPCHSAEALKKNKATYTAVMTTMKTMERYKDVVSEAFGKVNCFECKWTDRHWEQRIDNYFKDAEKARGDDKKALHVFSSSSPFQMENELEDCAMALRESAEFLHSCCNAAEETCMACGNKCKALHRHVESFVHAAKGIHHVQRIAQRLVDSLKLHN